MFSASNTSPGDFAMKRNTDFAVKRPLEVLTSRFPVLAFGSQTGSSVDATSNQNPWPQISQNQDMGHHICAACFLRITRGLEKSEGINVGKWCKHARNKSRRVVAVNRPYSKKQLAVKKIVQKPATNCSTYNRHDAHI